MKLLIFFVILFVAQAGAQGPADKFKDCGPPGLIRCVPQGRPVCPPGTVLTKLSSPRPGRCCNQYECIQDCTLVKCGRPLPESCPADSILIKGIILPGQCCPQPGRCECNPAGCVMQVCQQGYISVLVSKGSGKPGDCCDIYKCKLDCTTVKCGRPFPESCPEDSVLIEGIILPGQCCPQPGRCECKPAGCVEKECRPGYVSVLVSPGSGKPGNCCSIYECKPVKDCSMVMCPDVMPPPCPPGTVLVKRDTPIPGDCCNIYECRPDIDCAWCARPDLPISPPGTILIEHDIPRPWDCCNPYKCITDCTMVKCAWPMPKICPEDSVWIEGIILPGQCCPQPGRCECKPAGCVKKECRPGYVSVLVSPGSGKPGDCCDKYECQPVKDCSSVMCPAVMPPPCPLGTMMVKRDTPIPGDCCNIYECRPDCTMVKCAWPMPKICPEDSVWIEGIILPGQCCPQPGRCECKPAGCVKKECRPGYVSVLVSPGSGKPGDCCDKYECQPVKDCSLVMCPAVMPPPCPLGTMMVKRDTPIPGDCCNIYECRPDCTMVKCAWPMPKICPEDSVWIEGIILPGQCCPQPGRCECKPAGCVKKECRPGYVSVLVSPGSGKPGDCCDKYECQPVKDCSLVMCPAVMPPPCPLGTMLVKRDTPIPGDCCNIYECRPDCTMVKCAWPMPKICPEDSVWIEGIILPGQCCPQPGRCECKPAGCVKKECRPGYVSVLVSPGSGKPGDCCDKYECQPVKDCSLVMCPAVMPPPCPLGTMLVKRDTPIPGDCCNIYECRPVIDCATVRCARPEPPVCPPGTILIKHDTPRPWDCCNPYECITDCTMVKCGWPMPKICPEDSVWIEGIILPGQCCPQPGRCECKPAGCVKKECRPGYVSVLVSPGSGKPGDCCGVYDCKPVKDCSSVMCPAVMPPRCPPGTMLVKRDTPIPGDCCNIYECRPAIDCSRVMCAMLLPPTCPEGTVPTKRREIVSAGDCCFPWECEPDMTA